MLNLNQIITVVALIFCANGAVLAHQNHASQQGHAHKNAEIQFVRAEVVEVDTKHNELVLRHEAIKHLNMPSMTMAFSIAEGVAMNHLNEGDKIAVKIKQQGQNFVVSEMKTDLRHH